MKRAFVSGFLVGGLCFLAANLLATHLRSDCGLPALVGRSACADDIRRAGFPLLFWEEGGFAYRRTFNPPALFLDLSVGLGFAVSAGLVRGWRARRKSARPSP